MNTLDLIVLAAGKGTRMNHNMPKQFLELAGKPILIHTLEVFEQLDYVGTKFITAHPETAEYMRLLLKQYEITNFVIVQGGATRAESVRNALTQVGTRRVITHNAVLPFVTKQLVDNVACQESDCVTTVTPLEYNLCLGDSFAERIVHRDGLKLINSPQTFNTQVFRRCHTEAMADGYVPKSDCELMLHYDRKVRFVPGDVRNFKITTRLDLLVAQAIMNNPEMNIQQQRQTAIA